MLYFWLDVDWYPTTSKLSETPTMTEQQLQQIQMELQRAHQEKDKLTQAATANQTATPAHQIVEAR